MSASLSENAYNPVSILIWGWLKPWTRSRWFDAQVIQNCVFCNTLIGVELRRWARMAQPIELSFYGTSRCRQKWYTLGNGADRNYTPWGMAQTDMIHPGKWCRQIWYTLGNGTDRNDTPWGMTQTDMIHPGKWCRQKWYTLGNGTDRYDTPWGMADRYDTPWEMVQTDMIHPGKWCRQKLYTLGNSTDRYDTP